jgi:hypothetical protein
MIFLLYTKRFLVGEFYLPKLAPFSIPVTFLKILNENGKAPEARLIQGAFAYIDGLLNQLGDVSGKLETVQKQLDEIKDRKNPVVAACVKMVKSMQTGIGEMRAKLSDMRSNLMDFARQTIADFKQKGKETLNSVGEYFKGVVKAELEISQAKVQRYCTGVETLISRTESVGKEVRGLGHQTANVVRAVRGKEKRTEAKEKNGFIVKALTFPLKALHTAWQGLDTLYGKAITGLELPAAPSAEKTEKSEKPLEKAAEEKIEKPSAKNRVEDIKRKQAAQAKDAPQAPARAKAAPEVARA